MPSVFFNMSYIGFWVYTKLETVSFSRKEIIENVKLGKGKSQAYDYIKKAQAAAKELYDKYYR